MARRRKQRLIRIGMIKAESEWADVKRNIRLLEQLATPLKCAKLDVLITPECFLDGYMVRDRKRCTPRKLRARCVSGDGDPIVKRASRIAKLLKTYLVLGASERSGNGPTRNAAYLIDRKGKTIGTYYKVHPCEFYEPGNDLPVFKTDFAVVGILICADRRWPENARSLRLKGAEIILNPTWGWFGEDNTAIMRTRAYENGIPICFAHPEQSLICLPDATVGAVLESNRPAVLIHDVDLSENHRIRNTKDKALSRPIQNRRPDLYGAITRC